ncbi:MAG TPA: isochorismatase family cysteine hydrolase [Kribbella sp.]|uniref:cysteine hydrolase family protein n=1 Tax=Kribbella sp. TaxID=1871183 RepID=UPI002D782234|nr:isochorismatase family cysteine hydrolase [Kribbella sp.]HET6297008.1 isochorismatase family cysteine hydrolase [Kribbella sp.]
MDEYTSPEFGKSALLTVDLQRDFATGPYAIPGTTEVVPQVERLAEAFRAAGRPVVHAVRLYLPDGSNADLSRRALIRSGASIVAPGSPGSALITPPVELAAELLLAGKPQQLGENEYVLYKPRWSAFYQTELLAHLQDVSTVVVAGCNYPNCPRSTMIDATERDLRTVAARDALSQWTPAAPDELDALGIAVCSTEVVLSALKSA